MNDTSFDNLTTAKDKLSMEIHCLHQRTRVVAARTSSLELWLELRALRERVQVVVTRAMNTDLPRKTIVDEVEQRDSWMALQATAPEQVYGVPSNEELVTLKAHKAATKAFLASLAFDLRVELTNEMASQKRFKKSPSLKVPTSVEQTSSQAPFTFQRTRRTRHAAGRGNKTRQAKFVRFLVETFGVEFLRRGSGVVDVAGGKGELGFRLAFVFCVPCCVVEPREVTSNQENLRAVAGQVVRTLPLFYRARLFEHPTGNDTGGLRALPTHVRVCFPEVAAEITFSASPPIPLPPIPSPPLPSPPMQPPQPERKRLSGDDNGVMLRLRFHSNGRRMANVEDEGKRDRSGGSGGDEDDMYHSRGGGGCRAVALVSRRAGLSDQKEAKVALDGAVASNGEYQQQLPVALDISLPIYIQEGTAALAHVLQDCSIIVGMHPDEVTDAIVDTALRLGKPFAVVPCCYFPTLFLHRRLRGGEPVTQFHHYVAWLVEKGVGIKTETLGFGGRNVVVYRTVEAARAAGPSAAVGGDRQACVQCPPAANRRGLWGSGRHWQSSTTAA
jgi:hypothetical protein